MTGTDATLLTGLAAEIDRAPAFGEPWHAQVFAMTMHLAKRGVFSWDEWVGAFIAEVHRQPQAGDEHVDAAYFRQWLAALEGLLTARGLCAPARLYAYTETWRRAYLNTTHGEPVEFAAGTRPPANHGDHAHPTLHDARPRERAPIAVSPRRGT